ncbi:allantoate deiminase [Paenibacillus abyssi]|uniref:Allantoate amidohydrolase n=1 Tax=Paenibacillus abyssi TaxID=1340531 RepID=A0A917FQH4_9BACL|nr:allantoate deiminase [Paenibacillus abyssi]GGF99737.1 allantoate amidohydrolase [Paenibacillus abyssi]
MNEAIKKEAVELMLELLEELASFSADQGGVTRLLYTEQWRSAQRHVSERMRSLGLQVYADRVGNVYGRLPGSSQEPLAVLTGSHIDTVRMGGKFDGAYGVAAAIAAFFLLKKTYGKPKRTLEVVSLAEEEGSRFPLSYWGSGNITGIYDWNNAGQYKDSEGVAMADAMRAAGFGLAEQPDCVRRDLAAYIELHIEQGVTLERMEQQIGIVETIASQKRFTVTVTGAANHAGTTPMTMRKDAMTGAAEMILELEKKAFRYGEPLVATAGKIEAAPNMPNVIPGSVTFTLDIRHGNEKELSLFCNHLIDTYKEIATRRALKLDYELWMNAKPVQMDAQLTANIEDICKEQRLPYRRMVSGAGHDAQLFQAVCPAAMVFIPSKDGISHSPEEYSSPRSLTAGFGVLTALLYKLAYEEGLP